MLDAFVRSFCPLVLYSELFKFSCTPAVQAKAGGGGWLLAPATATSDAASFALCKHSERVCPAALVKEERVKSHETATLRFDTWLLNHS